jgi:hypothetical protein
MNRILKLVGYGFLVWLIPTLITTVLIYLPFTESLFDIISALAIIISVALFSYLYFKDVTTNFIKEGIIIAITWIIISIIFDLIMIIVGVSHTSIIDYALRVVPLYVIIPAITIGYGLQLDHNNKKNI